MKIILVLIIFIFISCEKNPEINQIINDKKVIREIDKYIVELDKEENVKFIGLTGTENLQTGDVELILANRKPTFNYNLPIKINQEMINRKYGYFKYKGYEFIVDGRLNNLVKLEYKNFDKMKDHFIILDSLNQKEGIINEKTKYLYLKYNKLKDSIESSKIYSIAK